MAIPIAVVTKGVVDVLGKAGGKILDILLTKKPTATEKVVDATIKAAIPAGIAILLKWAEKKVEDSGGENGKAK